MSTEKRVWWKKHTPTWKAQVVSKEVEPNECDKSDD